MTTSVSQFMTSYWVSLSDYGPLEASVQLCSSGVRSSCLCACVQANGCGHVRVCMCICACVCMLWDVMDITADVSTPIAGVLSILLRDMSCIVHYPIVVCIVSYFREWLHIHLRHSSVRTHRICLVLPCILSVVA